ncbi:MAG: HlyD family secretion protein [Thiohalocapsa sp.]|jgi:multidrug resistance efflux pump|uniref:HlyD family secretion protein n=1 Tax=Thiohalocapsa sp. TaxID=2497641 RepID=UPI0025F95A50|nr:HlyD family secretion protein [Thiohalocapsa sp.]MCG6943185.1 HlyD family secretion protein [Thiohalocapsa sp.]
MDLLLILTYAALCIAVFKIFRIPLNKWTVPTAVLGGVVLIGALLLLMNYNHPFSESFRKYYVTTPIIPEVRGRVVEVPVKQNTPIKQGDLLFKIDPAPFEDEVASLQARLAAAEKDLARAEELYAKQSGSERMVDQTRADVDDLRAKLSDARFDLAQTTVTAPSDGTVTQLALRPGMMALPFTPSPVMTFVHKDDALFVGWFRQEYLERLTPGSAAEVIFDGIPGRIFQARVDTVFPVIAEGQVKPSADFIAYGNVRQPGRVAVSIEVTDPDFAPFAAELPGGAYGQAAVYTEHFHHVGIMRKVLLRMASWMNFVFPLH